MRKGWGFTLLEVMVVVAVIGLLVSILVPAVHSAKCSAQLAACQAGLKSISAGLWLYTADHDSLFPPFAFSSVGEADLLLSGHWGGTDNPADPDMFGRNPSEMAHINLHALACDDYVYAKGLLCPGTDAVLRNGTASYFHHTDRFSTYCLRFPHSEDLYRDARELRNSGMGGQDVLGVYRFAASGHGQYVPSSSGVGRVFQVVPFVHSERTYRTGQHEYNPARSAILADAFWMQDYSAVAGDSGEKPKPVRRHRCHETKYNVLFGHGGVTTITDDGTVESNTVPAGEPPTGQSPYYEQAETLWAFFDSKN